MNTKNAGKLSLHRETLRTLDTADLEGVAGGFGITKTVTKALTKLKLNDTVHRPGQGNGGYNDTVYRGGGSKVIPV